MMLDGLGGPSYNNLIEVSTGEKGFFDRKMTDRQMAGELLWRVRYFSVKLFSVISSAPAATTEIE